jgi:Acyl-CoA synthetases (AMP-forming)/AMP-acid ligases II
MKNSSARQLVLEADDVRRVVTSLFNTEFSSPLWHTNDKPRVDAAVAALQENDRQRLVDRCLFFFDLPRNCIPMGSEHFSLDRLVESLCQHPLERFNFQTSGTTGTKKTITVALQIFASEATAVANYFVDRLRIVSVVPEHHHFGFSFSIVLPKYLNIQVLRMAPLPTNTFINSLRNGDLLMAFPRFWQALLPVVQHLNSNQLLSIDLKGLSSTSPCPSEVWDMLSQQLLCEMTEIYGSTETGAVGYRQNSRQPFNLLSHWVRIDDGKDVFLSRKRNQGEKNISEPLLDRMEWVNERQFLPLGRIDHAVQVGGVNVYPEEVAKVIATHPDVQECAVRLMRPEEGVRLKAFIVPMQSITLEECHTSFGEPFRRWLQQQFSAPSCPKAFSFGQDLPRNDMGKLSDW